jgi:hypothetical protein
MLHCGTIKNGKNMEILHEQTTIDLIPYYRGSFLIGQFIFDLHRLEESKKTGNRLEFARDRKRAFKSGRKAVKNPWKEAMTVPKN